MLIAGTFVLQWFFRKMILPWWFLFLGDKGIHFSPSVLG